MEFVVQLRVILLYKLKLGHNKSKDGKISICYLRMSFIIIKLYIDGSRNTDLVTKTFIMVPEEYYSHLYVMGEKKSLNYTSKYCKKK